MRHGTELLDLSVQLSAVQSLGRVRLFATPWTVIRQASLSITNSWSLLRFMSIEPVMPSKHLIPRCPLLLLPFKKKKKSLLVIQRKGIYLCAGLILL